MSLAYAVKPELPTPFPARPELWRCEKTGLYVPKDPDANLQWRAQLLREAEADVGFQSDLLAACRESILFWINAFAFTYRIQDNDEAGRRRQAAKAHIPFVTWEIQDKLFLEIEDAIDNGHDLLIDKSRDMGASWGILTAIHHQWLFRDERLFLEMSRVETDVDGADNPRCLFVKHDYINRWLPEWMRPNGVLPGQKYRTRMHLVNPENGSRIDGESSNKAAGSGDRRHAMLLDEFAKMENSEKIKASTTDVTPCRLVNSTPWGPGTTYSKWRMSGQIKVFTLPWYEHPEKGAGRYVKQEETSGKWKIRSPWYDLEATKRTPHEMAQEIDLDHIGSGDTFFEAHIVEEHKRLFAKEPTAKRSIDFKKGIASDAIPALLRTNQRQALVIRNNGPLRIWSRLIGGRLDQSKNYVIGADISKGQGASNSVLSVFCKETAEKVAEWADANTPPYDLARIACALALWVGGATHGARPLMCWEANGPGWDFGREVVRKYQYPYFFVDHTVGTVREKTGKRYGWHSSADGEKKETMLGNYRRAIAHGGFINHSAEALDEMLLYVRYADGGLGPSALVEESASARKVHGDRVIADGLALWAAGTNTSRKKEEGPQAPQNSIGGRKKLWDCERKNAQGSFRIGQRVNLTGG